MLNHHIFCTNGKRLRFKYDVIHLKINKHILSISGNHSSKRKHNPINTTSKYEASVKNKEIKSLLRATHQSYTTYGLFVTFIFLQICIQDATCFNTVA